MEQLIKQKIAHTFSRHSATYDQYSQLQKLSAGILVENIAKALPSLTAGPVLEVGCGSGLLSEEVIRRLPERDLCVIDISSGMLETCRNRLVKADLDQGRVQYLEIDAEKLSEQNRYALIFSGLTLQWFNDLAEGVDKIVKALLPGGIFVCSFLGDGSFREWQEQCEKSNIPCTLNELPDFSFLSDEFNKRVRDVSCSQNNLVLSYPSVHDFFVSLKKTGTGVNVSGKKNTLPEMRKLIKDWQESSPDGVKVTCTVNCLTITK